MAYNDFVRYALHRFDKISHTIQSEQKEYRNIPGKIHSIHQIPNPNSATACGVYKLVLHITTCFHKFSPFTEVKMGEKQMYAYNTQ